ncbi:hypothetical protein GEO20_16620 [Rhodococcus erythropolis]|uniref:hypothetical protein n=1 Tax=Rhodococcus erythropolis TaxID=1833 RepID=UPI0012919DFB|nr:hypothetical protein [Rhodococcus erythropolis]MQP33577.1 hypothetical protein [Rhodococcus erythropolis]
MSTLQIVRFTTHDEHTASAETEIRRVFHAVTAPAPEDMQYLAVRSGHEFLLALNHADPAANPLLDIEPAAHFRRALPNWTSDNAAPKPFTVIGNYNMLAPAQETSK